MAAENLPLSPGVGYGERESNHGTHRSRHMNKVERDLRNASKALLAVFQIPWQRRIWQFLAQHYQVGLYSLCVEKWPDLCVRKMRSARRHGLRSWQ